MVWVANIRGERPSEEIQRKGLCEVNLESNQIHDRAVYDMIQFLKDDNWLQCLNLKRNCITEGGISQFIDLMKTNTSLIVLDLRENEGFTKEYSK